LKQIPVLLLSGILFTACTKDNPGTTPDKSCEAGLTAAENIRVFPADNAWNKDVSSAPLAENSAQIVAGWSANGIKADFGSGEWEGSPIGIPYVVVCNNQAAVAVVFTDYGDESDPGPYPIPLDAPIEGNGTGDAHVIAVDVDNKKLYELYSAKVKDNKWYAASGAVFDLESNTLRPDGWTSADAAGLPIFPGLVRYEEIVKGEIDHPIRFTLQKHLIQPAYVHPARHKVNSTGGANSLPMGARIRLKANVDISGYSATNQVILKAMKKYGLILADIGSSLYISGAPDDRWDNDDLRKLGAIKGSDFEVVKF